MTVAITSRHVVLRFLPGRPAYLLRPPIPLDGPPSLLRPRSAFDWWYGNVCPLPIDFAFRLRLRGRLTLPG